MDLKSTVQQAINKVAEAIATGCVENVLALYTPDACFLAGDQRVLPGRQAIEGYIRRLFELNINGAVFTTETVEDLGGAVLEVGSYEMFTQGRQSVVEGDYMIVWKHQEEQGWLIHRDAFSLLQESLLAPEIKG
nr:SgcJ/EcaC family oxidoreductase [uncultured Pseudomonas sp.]